MRRYYPSVFILKPGQMVHINKGRLHAFRKLSPVELPETDCHHDLRKDILPTLDHSKLLCVSIAWDWMFKGVTSEGINREVSSILECARLNQRHKLQSLAIPEVALLFLAESFTAEHDQQTTGDSSFPDTKTVLRGILPGLSYVVHRHASAVLSSRRKRKVAINSRPNAEEDPSQYGIDPYGNGDFLCRICMEELSNVYMHCDGCENLLKKDFNICVACHSEGGYKISRQMHPFDSKRVSTLNHTGNMKLNRSNTRCPCKNGIVCIHCEFCTGCSCKCHQNFTLHYRFKCIKSEICLLEKATSVVGSDVLSHSKETTNRLKALAPDATPKDEDNDEVDIILYNWTN